MRNLYLRLFVFAGIVLIMPIKTMASEDSKARSLAREAYFQIEAHVFEPLILKEATKKIDEARLQDPEEAWVYLSSSLATLVYAYKIGDWYETNTFEQGAVEKAINLTQEGIKKDPQLSQAYAHLARLYIIQKKLKTAAYTLQTAYQLDPNNYYFWYFRGIIYEKLKWIQDSKACFDEAQKHIEYPHQTIILNLHRQRVAELSKDFGEQENLLKKNIQDSPDNPHVYGNYAYFLMKQARYDEAIEYWEKAIGISAYPEALSRLEETKLLKQEKQQQAVSPQD